MGTKYCKPVRDTSTLLDPLQSMTMLDVRTKWNCMLRTYNKRGYYFFTHQEFRDVFNFTDEQIYYIIETFSANREVIRVGSIDFWCALALSSSGTSDDKISYCFKLIDTNNDGHITYNELIVLLICSTRGVARLKGLDFVPEQIIDRVVVKAFNTYQKELNEHGELSLASFTEFILTNDACRTYMASLGAKMPPVDAAAMVMKRAHILRDLTETKFRIDEIMFKLEAAKDNYDMIHERGGDVKYLRMGDAKLPGKDSGQPPTTANSSQPAASALVNFKQQNQSQAVNMTRPGTSNTAVSAMTTTTTASGHPTRLLASSSMPTMLEPINEEESVDFRSTLSKDHPVNKYFGIDDSWIGEIYNKPKPYANKTQRTQQSGDDNESLSTTQSKGTGINIYGIGFEELLLKEWKKIPQDEDRLVPLDEFTLMALFDQLNIRINFYFARKCLQSIPCSQLNKHHFQDVLKWFRINYVDHDLEFDEEKNPSKASKTWFRMVRGLKDSVAGMRDQYQSFLRTMQIQRKIISGLSNTAEVSFAKKLAEFRSATGKKPVILMLKYGVNEPEVDPNASPTKPTSSVKKEIMEKLNTGFKCKFQWNTNPFTNLSTKRSRDGTRMKFISEEGRDFFMLQDYKSFDVNDILDYYNLRNEREFEERRKEQQQAKANATSSSSGEKKKKGQQADRPVEYASAAWLMFDISPHADYAQVLLMREAVRDFFQQIPLSFRQQWYSVVQVEVCCVEGEEDILAAKKKKKKKSTAAIDMMLAMLQGGDNTEESNPEQDLMWNNCKKVLLVVLLHEEDHFIKVEQQLIENDLYLSRAVLNVQLEVETKQNLKELYDYSLKHYQFNEKIFGPQEEELGEEGNNPLRFAKEIRSQKKKLSETIENLRTMPREELQRLCRESGIRDTGTNPDLAVRLKQRYEERMELIGFGELSGFGKQLLQQIYTKLQAKKKKMIEEEVIVRKSKANVKSGEQPDEERGLSFWEFNDLLSVSQSKTLYDKEAYQDLMEAHQLLVDRDFQLKLHGLHRYYEKYGKLYEDNLSWGVGSLDHFLTGKLQALMAYDGDALLSAANTIDASTAIYIPSIHQLIAKMTSLREFRIEGQLNKLSDFFDTLPWDTLGIQGIKGRLDQCFKKPGGFVEVLMETMEGWCDGEEGILAVLRQRVTQVLAERFPPPPAVEEDEEGDAEVKLMNDHEEESQDESKKAMDDAKSLISALKSEASKPVKPIEEEEEDFPKMKWKTFDQLFGQDYLDEVQAKINIALEEDDLKRQQEEEEAALAAAEAAEAAAIESESVKKLLLQSTANLKKEEEESTAEESQFSEEELQAQEKERQIAIKSRQLKVKDRVILEIAKKYLVMGFQEVLPSAEKSPNVHEEEALETASHLGGSVISAITDTHSEEFMPTEDNGKQLQDPSQLPPDDKEGEGKEEEEVDPNIRKIQKNEDWTTLRTSIVEDLIFLNYLRQVPNLELSLDESIALENRKHHLMELLQEIHVLETEHFEDLSFQFLAMYDCLRLFSTGISAIGLGTKDTCLRIQIEYNTQNDLEKNNLMACLPIGLGEFCHVKQLLREKQLRFEKRKMAALAALERERLRRQMTEEDHERLRLAKLEAQRLEYEKEEKLLFAEAFGMLLEARETRKSSAELNKLSKAFEKIILLKEQRFPDDFGVNVSKNNWACVLVEIYGIEHPLCEPVEYILKEAVEKMMKEYEKSIEQEKDRIRKERLASLPPPPETAEEEKGGLESLDQMSQSKAPLPLSKEEEGSAQERDKLAATRQSVASIDFDNSTIATLESFGSGGIDSFTKNLIVDHTLPSSDQSVTVDEETDSQVDAEPVPEPEPEIVVDMPIPFPCCSAMIIANYIDVVIKNDNHISLRSIFPVKLFMYNCFEAMNEIEQEKFLRGVVPEVSNIPVFVTNSKPEAVIKKVLDEVAYFTSKKRKDADLQRKKEEEEAIAAAAAAAAEEEASLAESLASLSTTKRLKKLNDMKKQKSLEARQRDNAIRAELSRQRKFMYELIQTDQITTIFAAKAGRGAEDGAGKWESPDDQDLISTANAEFANMIANSSKATKH